MSLTEETRVVRVNGVVVVVPERTNGYERSLPEHVTEAIAEYREANPDAEAASWAEVVAFCYAGSGCADYALSPGFVAVYLHAIEEWQGELDVDISLAGGGVNGRDLPVPPYDVGEAAEQLRNELHDLHAATEAEA